MVQRPLVASYYNVLSVLLFLFLSSLIPPTCLKACRHPTLFVSIECLHVHFSTPPPIRYIHNYKTVGTPLPPLQNNAFLNLLSHLTQKVVTSYKPLCSVFRSSIHRLIGLPYLFSI